MSFWESLRTVLHLAGAFHWVALGFIVVSLSLYLFVPAERTRIRTSFAFFGVSGLGLLSLAIMLSLGALPESIAFRSVKWVSLLAESIAIINLASIFLLDVALNSTRSKPPRILRDLLVATAYMV